MCLALFTKYTSDYYTLNCSKHYNFRSMELQRHSFILRLVTVAVVVSGADAQFQVSNAQSEICIGVTTLTSVPVTFAWSIQTLVITDANIASLSTASFSPYSLLASITISSSAVQTVQVNTFAAVLQTYIDLSNNPLGGSTVDVTWALGLTKLKTLKIQGGTIQSIMVSTTLDCRR